MTHQGRQLSRSPGDACLVLPGLGCNAWSLRLPCPSQPPSTAQDTWVVCPGFLRDVAGAVRSQNHTPFPTTRVKKM